MGRERAVALVSGGMDSSVTLAVAQREFEVAALHIRYGQRTEGREERAFHDLADYYGIATRLVVPMHHLSLIGGSSLTDRTIPVSAADLDARGVPSSYVPFRNASFLSVGVSWAEVLGASAVFIGAVEEDSSGYPDCRGEFFAAFERAAVAGTKPGTTIKIVAPVLHLSKEEIVRTAVSLGVPLRLTWSCYQREDRACGMCDSCALRLRGFQRAGVEDPIPYVTRPQYANT
jgi:7-cyano-7-deazaguanine synthase